ncbi:hypothetical protein AQUCO_03200061v1 [Aquilegia coerulea]|uniref:Uncharacterized protein n=1 Tax=Aquilegia coerulea TaxID=218851 RepID=A0A2G5D0W2_AQUCA|nr:hypothetical protein AQUCO_03200061v1 [Aquilegia coerulea]
MNNKVFEENVHVCNIVRRNCLTEEELRNIRERQRLQAHARQQNMTEEERANAREHQRMETRPRQQNKIASNAIGPHEQDDRRISVYNVKAFR